MAENAEGRLSREATTVVFNPALPILRVPLPAAQEDDPSRGPFVLAFQDEHAWLTAWQSCEVKIAERCEAGARMGCSISAARKCKPPWWHNILPFFSNKNRQENQEACEEQEMKSCLAAAEIKCASYAKETCEEGFSSSRIVNSSDLKKYRVLNGFSKEEAIRVVLDKGDAIKQNTFGKQR